MCSSGRTYTAMPEISERSWHMRHTAEGEPSSSPHWICSWLGLLTFRLYSPCSWKRTRIFFRSHPPYPRAPSKHFSVDIREKLGSGYPTASLNDPWRTFSAVPILPMDLAAGSRSAPGHFPWKVVGSLSPFGNI